MRWPTLYVSVGICSDAGRMASAFQVDVDVAVLDALDGAGDDVVRAVRKFIIDDVPFGFAQALDHDLFGSLGGDAAEIVRRDIDVDATSPTS